MIGLIFIYFLGKQFYELAEQFQKNKWLFGILGVLVYYGSMLGLAFITGIIVELSKPGFIDSIENSFLLDLAFIPVGLLCTWLFYKLLKKKWSKIEEPVDYDILDEGI